MDAKNLRRKSLAMESLCNAPPPETLTEGLRLVCLTAPLIEAMDPMHDRPGRAGLARRRRASTTRRADVEADERPLRRSPRPNTPRTKAR